MKVGDLIRVNEHYHGDKHTMVGTVIENNINMWGEETVPSGIVVSWSDSTIEMMWADEAEIITEPRRNKMKNQKDRVPPNI